jgi:hypothetical protein
VGSAVDGRRLRRSDSGTRALAKWCHKERDWKWSELAALRSGSLRTGQDQGQGWVDNTNNRIDQLGRQILELDFFLEPHDRGSSAKRKAS